MMFNLKEGKINSNEIFSMVVILLITKLFLGIPRVMVEEGGSAGWLLMLMSATIASVGVFFFVKLLKRFPGKNIIDIAELVLGIPGRVVVAFLFVLFFIYISTITMREFAESILTTVLPRTPISIIIFAFILTMLYGAYRGIEVIARSTRLLFPFIVGGLISILLLTANFIDWNNLFPLLGTGVKKIALLAPGRSSFFIDMIFVGLIVSSINDYDKITGEIWKGFIFSVFLYILVQVIYVSVFTFASGSILYVPMLQLARTIYMGRFIQRIEAIYIFIWYFTAAIQLTMGLYGAAIAFCQGFKIPIYQPVLFPLSLLIFSLSFIPGNILSSVYYDISILREYGAVFAWGLPAFLLFISILRKKGGVQNAGKNQGNH